MLFWMLFGSLFLFFIFAGHAWLFCWEPSLQRSFQLLEIFKIILQDLSQKPFWKPCWKSLANMKPSWAVFCLPVVTSWFQHPGLPWHFGTHPTALSVPRFLSLAFEASLPCKLTQLVKVTVPIVETKWLWNCRVQLKLGYPHVADGLFSHQPVNKLVHANDWPSVVASSTSLPTLETQDEDFMFQRVLGVPTPKSVVATTIAWQSFSNWVPDILPCIFRYRSLR